MVNNLQAGKISKVENYYIVMLNNSILTRDTGVHVIHSLMIAILFAVLLYGPFQQGLFLINNFYLYRQHSISSLC